MCWCGYIHPRNMDEAQMWTEVIKARKAEKAETVIIAKAASNAPDPIVEVIRADLDSQFAGVRMAARKALEGL